MSRGLLVTPDRLLMVIIIIKIMIIIISDGIYVTKCNIKSF